MALRWPKRGEPTAPCASAVDRRAGVLWVLDGAGRARGTSLATGARVERALASSVERVVTAELVFSAGPRALLVVQQPSAGFARVLLARLDDGAVSVLARSLSTTPEAEVSLDGRHAFVREAGTRDVFARWSMADGARRGAVRRRPEDREALAERFADEGRVWRATREGLFERAIEGDAPARPLLRFERPADECALAVSGSGARWLFVRDALGARIHAIGEDGGVGFVREFAWGAPTVTEDGDGVIAHDDAGRPWRLDARGAEWVVGAPGFVLAATEAAWLCDDGAGGVAWIARVAGA
jgi:hypothetical protein